MAMKLISGHSQPIRVLISSEHSERLNELTQGLMGSAQLQVFQHRSERTTVPAALKKYSPAVTIIHLPAIEPKDPPIKDTIVNASRVTKTIVVSDSDKDEALHDALQAGVRGFLQYPVSKFDILKAVHDVWHGHIALSPHLVTRLVARYAPAHPRPHELSTLRPRELELLKLIGEGASNLEIAQSTSLTENTVKSYVTQLTRHLGVKNRLHLAIFAQRYALVDSFPGEPSERT